MVVRKAGHGLDRAAMLAFLAARVARWWLPDDAVFVEQPPHTATGKLQKMQLREQFRDYAFPA